MKLNFEHNISKKKYIYIYMINKNKHLKEKYIINKFNLIK